LAAVSVEVKKEIELEIAYVLFVDIVGYSKLVTSEQRRLLELLNQIVRESEHFRAAEAKHRLLTVPTGDGMALVFYNTPAAPMECALEISTAASEHPDLQLRMGIHSGPVSGVVDVSGRSNNAYFTDGVQDEKISPCKISRRPHNCPASSLTAD